MVYWGSGRVSGRIELGQILRKRRYPKGKRALHNIEEHFEALLRTTYKDAPKKWKKDFATAVFGGLQRIREGRSPWEPFQKHCVERAKKSARRTTR